jgi:hypothetical protein
MEQSVIDTSARGLTYHNPEICYERGPLSLVSTIEELLERKCSGSGLENRDYCHKDQPR